MADIAAVSRTELAERRRRLRRQRRLRALQASWRLVAVAGMAGGLVWTITLPSWTIRSPQQVAIRGNTLLSTEAIQSLLPIAYPQSLFLIQPAAIAQQLEAQAPIAQATVTRKLLPPGLTVRLQERQPVAVAFTALADAESSSAQAGLLDANGTWMPLESYTSLNQALVLPTLKVFGMREQYRSRWQTLYPAVSASPVKIFEVDWRKSDNLILKTEFGFVHFGAYGSQFPEQLKALDRMRQLPETINLAKIAYIDLKNPGAPLIQMVKDQRQIEPRPEQDP